MDVQTATVVIAGISVIIGVVNSILSSRRAAQNDQLMLESWLAISSLLSEAQIMAHAINLSVGIGYFIRRKR